MANAVEVSKILVNVDFAAMAAAAAARAAEKAEKAVKTSAPAVVTAQGLVLQTLRDASVGAWVGKVVLLVDPMPSHKNPLKKRVGEYNDSVHQRVKGWAYIPAALLPDGVFGYCYTGKDGYCHKDADAYAFAANPANWREAPAQE